MDNSLSLIRDDLRKQALSPRLILGNCHLLDAAAKNAPAFCEHSNLPFYYYLAKYLPRNELLNFGFGLGLPLIFYMLGNKVRNVFAQHDPGNGFYSPRLGISNAARVVKRKIPCFVGPVDEESFIAAVQSQKWGAVIISSHGSSFDSLMYSMNICWDYLTDDGYICLDHTGSGNSRNASENFAKLCNRKVNFISSRYGHSIIFKDI